MPWTLSLNSTEKTVADWGFSHLRRRLVSQAADEFSLVCDGAAADALSPLVPFQSILTLRRDRHQDASGNWIGGTIWFQGIVTQLPRHGSPGAESNTCRVAGPWWYLENRVFEKTFNILDHLAKPGDLSSAVYVQKSFSHSFLYIGPTQAFSQFNMITTGAQIVEALDWALKPFVDVSLPPPFQIGSVTPDLHVPFAEIRDLTCAEVIRMALRWSPDAVTWFDYSTNPPTFHCQTRSALPVVSLSL